MRPNGLPQQVLAKRLLHQDSLRRLEEVDKQAQAALAKIVRFSAAILRRLVSPKPTCKSSNRRSGTSKASINARLPRPSD